MQEARGLYGLSFYVPLTEKAKGRKVPVDSESFELSRNQKAKIIRKAKGLRLKRLTGKPSEF